MDLPLTEPERMYHHTRAACFHGISILSLLRYLSPSVFYGYCMSHGQENVIADLFELIFNTGTYTDKWITR